MLDKFPSYHMQCKTVLLAHYLKWNVLLFNSMYNIYKHKLVLEITTNLGKYVNYEYGIRINCYIDLIGKCSVVYCVVQLISFVLWL